jgi:hypothetical protein
VQVRGYSCSWSSLRATGLQAFVRHHGGVADSAKAATATRIAKYCAAIVGTNIRLLRCGDGWIAHWAFGKIEQADVDVARISPPTGSQSNPLPSPVAITRYC